MIAGNWSLLDRWCDVAGVSRHIARPVPVAESQFAAIRKELVRSPRSAEDFISFRDSTPGPAEQKQQRAAWIAMRITKMRPWLVGTRLFIRSKGSICSPMLNQCKVLGLDVAENFGNQLNDNFAKRGSVAGDRLDAICISRASGEVAVFKAVSFGALQSRGLTRNVGRTPAPLFAEAGQVMSGIRMPSEQLRSLIRTRMVLSAAAPDLKVRLFALVVDDGFSWQYQCHEATALQERHLKDCAFALDDLDFHESNLKYAAQMRKDPDYLSKFPGAHSQLTLRDALALCPVDRGARVLMAMVLLEDLQAANRDRLAVIEATQLGRAIQETYSIAYTDDMRRHDFEDGLRAADYAARVRSSTNAYAIRHIGVSRILTLRHKYNKMAPTHSAVVLDLVAEQLELWRRYSGRLGC